MLDHGREIAVVVEQGHIVLDAPGADDDIRILADRNTKPTQASIVCCGADGDRLIQDGP